MASQGFQRFQYRRAGNQPNEPWFRLGPVEATTTTIVTALCVVGFFLYAADPALTARLILFPDLVFRGQIWRIVTWPLADVPTLSGAISVAMFWYCGTQIERTLGRRRYGAFLAAVLLIPTALLLVFQLPEAGIHAISFALFVGLAVQNPEARWFFGIKIWAIAAVYVGLDVLRLLGGRSFHELWVLLVSLSVMVTGLRAFGEAASLPMFPKLPLIDRVRLSKASTNSVKSPKLNKRATPTKGSKRTGISRDLKPAKAGNTSGSNVVPGPWPSGAITQFEVDRLLEKIGQTGIDSLTAEERVTLDRASKNLRDRRTD